MIINIASSEFEHQPQFPDTSTLRDSVTQDSELDLDTMSDQPEESTSRSNRSRGRRRSNTSESLRRPLLATAGSVDVNNIDRQRDMRRRIAMDLPRMNRSFDPNRVVLEIPPEFLSPQQSTDEGKEPDLELHDPRYRGVSQANASTPPEQSSSPKDPANEIVRRALEDSGDASASFNLGLDSSKQITVLGAGRIDPFAGFPIKMNEGELWLIDQVNTGQDPTFRTFRERWLPVAVKDAAIFHQFLANVSMNISRVRGEDLNNAISIAHHSVAIRFVNQKLSNPESRTSDNVVVSILAFVCWNTIREDFHSASIHLDGLRDVIRLRGGFETIEHKPVLASLLFGVDMTRSLRQDTKPQFPLPKQLLQDSQNEQYSNNAAFIPTSPSSSWKQIFPSDHIMISVFGELQQALEFTRLKTARNQQWTVVNFAVFHLYPIIHKLQLNTGLDVDSKDQWGIMQEASRLGIILFMGEIRRRCGALGVSTRLYVSKLKVFMEGLGSTIDWTTSNALLLWIMFFGLLESWNLPEQDWYVESMYAIMDRTTLQSWDAVVCSIKLFLWVDGIFEDQIDTFRGIVSRPRGIL